MNIELHIERLVLEGLPIKENQRHALRAAIEDQLTRVLTRKSSVTRPGLPHSESRISAMPITYSQNEPLNELGKKVAMSIGEVLP